MKAQSLVATLLLVLASPVICAAAAPALPEPGVLELLGVGAIAAVAMAIRNRRK